MNTKINVPTRNEVNPTNQEIFDGLEKAVGFVPNLFATYAHSNNALKNFLDFSGGETSLKAKEKEVVYLAVSEVNSCQYCLSAHTVFAGMNGFTPEQILDIRSGKAPFDNKLDALARLSKDITENRGATSPEVLENYFAAGWTKENLIDTINLVGDKTSTNYVHRTTQVPIDFPIAQPLNVAV